MMTPRRKLTLAAALALATAAGGTVVLAQGAFAHGRDGSMRGGHAERMQQRFAEADADSDGKLTAAEMRAARQARFAKADLNGDGKLTIEEMDEVRKAERLERLSRMVVWLDADGDGMLSAEEYNPRRGRMLSRLDANGDGALSQEEMRAAGERSQHRYGGHHMGGHHMEGQRMGGGQTDGQKN